MLDKDNKLMSFGHVFAQWGVSMLIFALHYDRVQNIGQIDLKSHRITKVIKLILLESPNFFVALFYFRTQVDTGRWLKCDFIAAKQYKGEFRVSTEAGR